MKIDFLYLEKKSFFFWEQNTICQNLNIFFFKKKVSNYRNFVESHIFPHDIKLSREWNAMLSKSSYNKVFKHETKNECFFAPLLHFWSEGIFFQIATALLHLLHTKKSWELFWDWQRSTPNSSFEAYSNGINSRQVHIWKGLAETNPHSGAKVSRTVKNSQWSKRLFQRSLISDFQNIFCSKTK